MVGASEPLPNTDRDSDRFAQSQTRRSKAAQSGIRRLKAVVQYDGAGFSGFQRQKEERTVQSVLESALTELLGHPVVVKASGRTDAGVHARGQVISFTTSSSIPASRIPAAVSTFLPSDVIFECAEDVDMDFDPQMDAVEKTYCYRIWRLEKRDIFWTRYSHSFPWKLDFGLLEDEAAAIFGKHDFLSFRAEGSSAKTTVREVTEARWVKNTANGRGPRIETGDVASRTTCGDAGANAHRHDETRHFYGKSLSTRGAVDANIHTHVCDDIDMHVNDAARGGADRYMGAEPVWEFWISADGFLYKMVRLLVGTMLDVGRGHLSPGTIAAALENPDNVKVKIGACAPAKGLCLEEVEY